MTDMGSISSDHYTSSSSPSYTTPSPRHPSPPPARRALPVAHHRPPPLNLSTRKNDTAAGPRRPQSQPVMPESGSSGGDVAMATAKPLLPPTPGSASYARHENEHGGSRNKKRAKSIDVDEANQSSIARLSLYTPSTARNEGPRELICLCAKAPKVPRPRNGTFPVIPVFFLLLLFQLVPSRPCVSRSTRSPRDLVPRCHRLSASLDFILRPFDFPVFAPFLLYFSFLFLFFFVFFII
jgi:hypothetical protein